MKVFFLDQSGQPGGAELCLLDIAKIYQETCLVGLFADGSFPDLLKQHQIPCQIFNKQAISVRKESGLLESLNSISQLLPLITQVSKISRNYDLIYANTQKALVVGAIASLLSRRPLVYHLHDILSLEHFSSSNRRLAVSLANRFASVIIANSQASRNAFIAAGGKAELTQVVYNGFATAEYLEREFNRQEIRQSLGINQEFVVGHFSRLSPWKGQHILIDSLVHCPENVTVILVGDALFGEQDYVEKLHQKVAELGLQKRVKFLGFRSDVPQLMSACDLVAHTSTAPEPFGRVIVEAMLCNTPIVAAAAGAAIELVEHGTTGWLTPPGNSLKLADVINTCQQQQELATKIAKKAQEKAQKRFDLKVINQQIGKILQGVVA